MTDIDLLEDVAPASNELGAMTDMAQRMYDLQNEITQLEETLKSKTQVLTKLAENDIPDLMQELNMKKFTLINGSEISIEDFLSASVPSQGAIDRAKELDQKAELKVRQQQCFNWLRANDGAHLIKSNVEVQFGREEDEKCNEFAKELDDKKLFYRRAIGVHSGSLKTYLNKRIEAGKDVDHELFRIYSGRKANIRRK